VASDSVLADIVGEYYIVRVEVQFSTSEIALVSDFIDAVYNSEQLFIIDEVQYTETDGTYISPITVSFLAIYDLSTSN